MKSKSCTDRKSTRLNSSHLGISYAVFCLKKKDKRISVKTAPAGDPFTGEVVAPSLAGDNSMLVLNVFFFFNDRAPTEIYPLSLPDALPISDGRGVLPPVVGGGAARRKRPVRAGLFL